MAAATTAEDITDVCPRDRGEAVVHDQNWRNPQSWIITWSNDFRAASFIDPKGILDALAPYQFSDPCF